MLGLVRLRATYEDVEWLTDDQDNPIEEPSIRGGFTDPDNPWGGFKAELPEELCGDAARAWMLENVTELRVDAWTAALYVLRFPGGVWDYSESEAEQDVRSGVWRSVTLHVEDHAATVFELAEWMQTASLSL